MCCVSDAEPIRLPGQNSKDPYLLPSLLSLQFSVLFSSLSVSQRLVESYFKPLKLNVGTRFSSGFV